MDDKKASAKMVFTTSLDKDLLKEIRKLAIDKEVPVNVLLEDAIRDYLEKQNKPMVRKKFPKIEKPTKQ